MANNYLELSETIDNVNEEENQWFRDQLQYIYVAGGSEYTDADLPEGDMIRNVEKQGIKIWLDVPPDAAIYEPETVGFGYEIDTNAIWLYAEEWVDLKKVIYLVQKFLKKFHPDQVWGATYSMTCSLPRIGEFGGGGIVVTADDCKWFDSHVFVAEQMANLRRKLQAKLKDRCN